MKKIKSLLFAVLFLTSVLIFTGCDITFSSPADNGGDVSSKETATYGLVEDETGDLSGEDDIDEEYDLAFGQLNSITPAYYKISAMYSDETSDWTDAYGTYGETGKDVFLYLVPYGTGIFGTPGEDYCFVWWDKDSFYMDGEESPYSLEDNGTILTAWNIYYLTGIKFVRTVEIPDYVPALYKEINLQAGNLGYLWVDYPAVFGDRDNLTIDNYDDFIGYLLEVVPEAQAYIDMGMSALVTGDTSELEGFTACMNVELGTNHEDNFVREIFYAVAPNGDVFKYDPVSDEWEVMFGAGAVG